MSSTAIIIRQIKDRQYSAQQECLNKEYAELVGLLVCQKQASGNTEDVSNENNTVIMLSDLNSGNCKSRIECFLKI